MFPWGSKRNTEAEIFISILDAHKYAAYFEAQNLLQDKNLIEESILQMVRRMFLIRDLWPDLSFREVRGLILILVRSACADIMEEEKGTAPLDMDEIIPGKWESSQDTMGIYIEPGSWALLLDNTEHMNQKLMDIALLRYYFNFSFETISLLLNITPEAASYRGEKMNRQVSAGLDMQTLSKTPVEGWVSVQEEGQRFLEGVLLRQWESRQERPTPMEKIYLSARFESRVLRYIRNLFKGKESMGKTKNPSVYRGGILLLVGFLILAGSIFLWDRSATGTEGVSPGRCFFRVCHFLGWKDGKIQEELLQQYMPLELPRGMIEQEEKFVKGCRWVIFSDGNKEVLMGVQSKEFDPSELLEGNYVFERIEMNEREARLCMGQRQTALLWQKEDIYFCLLSDMSSLDLIVIGESVQKEK